MLPSNHASSFDMLPVYVGRYSDAQVHSARRPSFLVTHQSRDFILFQKKHPLDVHVQVICYFEIFIYSVDKMGSGITTATEICR